MDSSFLTYFQQLKDSMTGAEVSEEFNKLPDLAEQDQVFKYDICDALAERQYHTYTHLNTGTKSRIAEWLKKKLGDGLPIS